MNNNPQPEIVSISFEDIAKRLFSEDPKPPCTQQIMIENNFDIMNTSLVFELMLTIFMEGMVCIFDQADIKDWKIINRDILMQLDPWVKSMGFDLVVDVVDKNERQSYDGGYCKIVLNDDGDYGMMLKIKGITKPYHFFLHPLYVRECNIQDITKLWGNFFMGNQVFKIGFKKHTPPLDIVHELNQKKGLVN